MIKTLKESLVYSDSWLSFYKDDVSFPGGEIGTYVKLRRKSGAGVVLINPENKSYWYNYYDIQRNENHG